MTSVIVRELPGSGAEPERAVADLGGRVTSRIRIIDAFVAKVPLDGLSRLRTVPGVHSVTVNRRVRLLGRLDGWDHEHDLGSMHSIAQEVTGAGEMWNDRWTGKGVDIALIDSGVLPVDGLRTPGKVVTGPDLSFESQAENLRYLDTFGHGTHMAGIIAGRDDRAPQVIQKGASSHFVGMAPDARILSIKVADAGGTADVSQVIAAIDWVVQHRQDQGLNIRVLNLSFGTDGTQDYRIDPLTYAVEVAWRKGIVVVVAAGNEGYGSAKLNNPAYDPYVIAVGAADGRGTYDVKDDVVAAFSSAGDGTRNPDLLAPGKSVVSLRAPGSHADQMYPEGRVGASRFFKGSGTSQAAAVVSGAAALLIEQRPNITPDQLKALLKASASRLPLADPVAQGAGMLNLKLARDLPTPPATQVWPTSTGVGSLELSRGSAHVVHEGVELRGEQDILGGAWDGNSWSGNSWSANSWTGGVWNGNSWTGDCWCAQTWTGNSWSGNSWTGNSWSGNSWSGNSWSGNSWSGNSWSSQAWSDAFHGTASNANAWSSGAWGD
jgi:hypothetical protein